MISACRIFSKSSESLTCQQQWKVEDFVCFKLPLNDKWQGFFSDLQSQFWYIWIDYACHDTSIEKKNSNMKHSCKLSYTVHLKIFNGMVQDAVQNMFDVVIVTA